MNGVHEALIAIALWQFAVVMFQVVANRRISSMHCDVIRTINQLRNELAAERASKGGDK